MRQPNRNIIVEKFDDKFEIDLRCIEVFLLLQLQCIDMQELKTMKLECLHDIPSLV